MSKQFPPADLDVEIVAPTKLEATLKEMGAAKGGGVYMIQPDSLTVMEDFNVRVRNTTEWEAQVSALMDSIRANGFQADKPISVVAALDGDDTVLWVVDGHTRLEAVNRLIEEGMEIETVPVVIRPKTTTFADMLVSLVTSNSGKPLTPYEMAIVVRRLQNLDPPVPNDEIARRLGITKVYVGNLTLLADAPAKIRNQVVAGKLSATEAVKIIREHGEDASEVVEAAADEAKRAGKSKITGKSVKAAAEEVKGTKSEKTPKKGKPAPVVVAITDRHAIDYACDVAADGITWLKAWRSGDAEAVAELESYVDPHGGL